MGQQNSLSNLMNAHADPGSFPEKQTEYVLNKHDNSYLADPNKGMSLCADLVAYEQRQGEAYSLHQSIVTLINEDFLNHTETGTNTIQTTTYVRLKRWLDQLAEAIYFPALEQNHTIAVGGAFSAGKTRFLNTVLGCPSLLPTDTTPTTSIPTYIFKSQQDNIHALNFFGKKTAIDEEALKAISHAFKEKYQVTFSHILQMIAVERKNFKYSNLIFLDTPGYTKADNIQQENNTDENLARSHLHTADYLIWLIDLQNGTVPQNDIHFIQSLEYTQPILFVISKADKKPREEVHKIIQSAKQALEQAQINYVDVIAYSAQLDQEISEAGNRLKDFLSQINQSSDGSTLKWSLKQIFKQYLNFYDSNREGLKLTLKIVNELIFEEKISDINKSHLQNLGEKTKKQIDDIQKQRKQAEKIQEHLLKELDTLCQLLGIHLTETPNAVQIRARNKKNKQQSQQHLYYLDALLEGNLKQVANLPNLDHLNGEIVKIGSVGVTITLQEAPDINVLILNVTLAKQAPDLDKQALYKHLPVKVQIIDNKKCAVSIVIND